MMVTAILMATMWEMMRVMVTDMMARVIVIAILMALRWALAL